MSCHNEVVLADAHILAANGLEHPLFPYIPPMPPEPSSEERIRDAALKSLATRGIAATSLRVVAEAAGVSIGLVQHYFGTKAALVTAVDQYVLQVISEGLGAAAMPDAPGEALIEAGKRLTKLMVDHPLVIDYLGHALTEGGEIGSVVFDGLVGISAGSTRSFPRPRHAPARPGPIVVSTEPTDLARRRLHSASARRTSPRRIFLH